MLYFLTIFISAFLLFLIQPMIAKVILPTFGGGAAVWTVSMLFFQTVLLAGYCYAHALIKWAKPSRQMIIHCILLMLALLFTPITVDKLDLDIGPQISILAVLLVTVGLPYFALAANAPLIQRWFAYDKPAISPYKLYALSNVGSLLGLLAYPFIVEPYFSLDIQLQLWSVGYWIFVGCCMALAIVLFLKSNTFVTNKRDVAAPTSLLRSGSWIVLSAMGVIGLLAITNSMTQNISSVPFLWLLPLALYLVSFILCFGNERITRSRYWFVALCIALPVSFLLYFFASLFPIVIQVTLYSYVLFIVCMVCHGELVRAKPVAVNLTSYYLAMSVGGVVGGLVVNFVAPLIFDQFVEFPLIVWGSMVVAILYAVNRLTMPLGRKSIIAASCYALVAFAIFVVVNDKYQQYDIASARNFYGQLSVKDIKVGDINERRLVDGTTSHGTQSLDPLKSQIPLSYYRNNSGVSAAIKSLQAREQLDIVIIGLGAGTLAAYGRESDTIEFLELNPLVKDYALQYFTYIKASKSDISVTIGDGRQLLKLANFDARNIDLLVVDAFSSDAIPVHLLTNEAMALYKHRIADDGIIAIHISNSHLDLVPLIYGLAESQSLSATFVLTDDKDSNANVTQWVLLAKQPELLNHRAINAVKTPWPSSVNQPIVWTDDYSNLMSVLK